MRLWQVSHYLSFASEVEHEFPGVKCLDIHHYFYACLKDTNSFFFFSRFHFCDLIFIPLCVKTWQC